MGCAWVVGPCRICVPLSVSERMSLLRKTGISANQRGEKKDPFSFKPSSQEQHLLQGSTRITAASLSELGLCQQRS